MFCCEMDCPHDQIVGAAQREQQRIDKQLEKKEKEEDILKYKKSTHNLMWFHRSNR